MTGRSVQRVVRKRSVQGEIAYHRWERGQSGRKPDVLALVCR